MLEDGEMVEKRGALPWSEGARAARGGAGAATGKQG